MSLVAYGDSDDGSSDSEGEGNTNFPPKTSSFSAGEPSTSSAKREEETTPSTSTAFEDVFLTNSGKRSRLSSLLPKPNNPNNATAVLRSNFSTLDTQNLDEEEDEIIEVEEEYVPLSQIKKDKKTPVSVANEEQKSVGSLFSRMPSPWSFGTGISVGKKKGSEDDEDDKSRKRKQPVRIVAPTISEDDLDDDDEEKEPIAKKPMKSKTGSGLSSLLPKPRHSITTTSYNPNKPIAKLSNRPLIPHTLTKKPAPAKKNAKKGKKTEDDGSVDEDDGEPVAFFSFSEKKSVIDTNEPKDFKKIKLETSVTSVNILGDENPIDAPKTHNKSETITGSLEVNSTEYSAAMNSGTPGVESAHASVSYVEEGSPYGSTSAVSHYYDTSEGASTTYYQPTAGPSQQYSGYGAYSENPGYYAADGTQGMYNQTYGDYAQEQTNEQTDDIDMEKLKRLQGKRNRNEQINIIDINAADQTGDTQLQMTKITSEQIAHRPSKKKGNMPSSQQRRKHQITYLAFQAKEREFELQQQWSSNRQTKRQTQAKYGF